MKFHFFRTIRHLQMAPRMLKVVDSGLPLVMIFSERDKLLPKEHFHSFAKLLGIGEISTDQSEATHRSRNTSNESSQEQLNKTPPEINNNFETTDLHLADDPKLLQEKLETLKIEHQMNSDEKEMLKQIQALEDRLKLRTDKLSKGQAGDEDDDDDDKSLSTDEELHTDSSEESNGSTLSGHLITSTSHQSINGPKFAVSISKAGHYSLITHSHVISDQIERLTKMHDLRTSARMPGSTLKWTKLDETFGQN